MTEDIFDIVDENDKPIGSLPRSEVHSKGLYHRASHILVFNPDYTKILLQKRSATKDSYPNIYTTSCSGHVDSGETYDIAAVREMKEETGVSIELSSLRKIGKIDACIQTGKEFTFVYELKLPEDTQFNFPPDEVDALEWVRVEDFERMIFKNPKDFTPTFLYVYEYYRVRKFGGNPQNI